MHPFQKIAAEVPLQTNFGGRYLFRVRASSEYATRNVNQLARINALDRREQGQFIWFFDCLWQFRSYVDIQLGDLSINIFLSRFFLQLWLRLALLGNLLPLP